MAAGQDQKPPMEYTAQAASPFVKGEVKMTIGENTFTVKGLFDILEIPYAIVNSIEFADYTVIVRTDDGDYSFSRMGNWAQPFYDALCEAYRSALLRSFFVKGTVRFTASGDYKFVEDSAMNGKAPIKLFDDCVVALPPNGNARRIPLCFVNGLDKGDLSLTLKLNMGEEYTFSRLGYESDRFAEMVEKQIRSLHEKAVSMVKEIDPLIGVNQASQVGRLVPEGAAAQMGQLASIAPTFVAAIEEKLSKTRAAETYKAFKELCDPAKIWLGFKKNDIRSEGNDPPGKVPPANIVPGNVEAGKIIEGAPPVPGATEEQRDPYLFWMIVPSPDGQYAAVEFAVRPGEAAATFVYKTNGDFSRSAAYLNRALEAIDFKREVIRLSDNELRLPENVDYYMAAKHTASLQYIRKNFVGRVIHTETWKNKLTEMWSGGSVGE